MIIPIDPSRSLPYRRITDRPSRWRVSLWVVRRSAMISAGEASSVNCQPPSDSARDPLRSLAWSVSSALAGLRSAPEGSFDRSFALRRICNPALPGGVLHLESDGSTQTRPCKRCSGTVTGKRVVLEVYSGYPEACLNSPKVHGHHACAYKPETSSWPVAISIAYRQYANRVRAGAENCS